MINLNKLDDVYLREQYNNYLVQHINNVQKGYEWLCNNLPEVVNDDYIKYLIQKHDESKYGAEEYMPYARYFYGKKSIDKKISKKEIEKIDSDFDYAWLHHIHNNPHHWQYWLLQNDEDGLKILDMPYEYIIEMICDWWAFSWKANNLFEIFNWYEINKVNMKLSNNTKKTLENILSKMREKL